ncbi:MAG: hypothetical protein A2X59_04460 [Nitrospirae bacterium GWC2_42_7]|nr:MAG: hypothetical protein A2X59_04460 [Nitrospirae bacterium GWC2_42_7]
MKVVQVVSEDPISGKTKRKVSSPGEVYKIMGFLKKADREKFYVLHLDTKSNVIAKEMVSMGTLSYAVVHPREIFKGAILNNASSIICVHNHPSGDSSPSKNDMEITKRIKEAGSLIGIQMLDHIIIGSKDYYSFESAIAEKASLENLGSEGLNKQESVKHRSVIDKKEKKTLKTNLYDKVNDARQKHQFMTLAAVELFGSEESAYGEDTVSGFQLFMSDIENELGEVLSMLEK